MIDAGNVVEIYIFQKYIESLIMEKGYVNIYPEIYAVFMKDDHFCAELMKAMRNFSVNL